MFRFVDLFSGCGGLSLGLRSAGGQEALAVERAKDAAHTYFHNLVRSELSFEDYFSLPIESQIDGGLLARSVETLLEKSWSPSIPVDVVAGGPPCQGFSLAGKRDSADARNQLVWRFLDVVNALNPKIVVIENVEGMNQRFADVEDPQVIDQTSTFAQVLLALQQSGERYRTFGLRVNAMHFGAAQHRPRLMALGIRVDLADRLGLEQGTEIWSSTFEPSAHQPIYAPKPTVSEARTVAEAIGDLATNSLPQHDLSYVDLVNSEFGPWALTPVSSAPVNNEKRRHRPGTQTRFRVLQRLSDLGANPRLLGPMSPAHRNLALTHLRGKLADHENFRFDDHEDVLNAEEFVSLVEVLANSKHSQRVLRWAAPARTVMTIPDDHIHPDEPRTFTVREMARFQGFPDNFEFKGKATTGGTSRRSEVPQYSQVGNAVSPFVARAIGEVIQRILADPRLS